MIFVTVGTQKFQFNRLFKELDNLCENNLIEKEIVAQAGYSTYQPTSFPIHKILPSKLMNKYFNEANFIITHGGTSSIFQALNLEKKVIVVPRLKKFNEHIDDHQIEICEILESQEYITVVWEIENLHQKILESKNKKFRVYKPTSKTLVNEIVKYAEEI
ncbi:glycosyltransferase family 28 [Bacillus idriensis]|uniref:Glycosyltransferase family 28 n=1 Tax=Metabacillus idriensis TaxID=324768 RepID=A0A6I2MA82_9BACI|nr:PssE/Cps14G family polysaccharide biosynthesis glycosyltransferase [Metabacillus idriensis]MRX54257.1 glycosyltransferase family 28 [Metabacillus idriensis]